LIKKLREMANPSLLNMDFDLVENLQLRGKYNK
jgi:hypothetical protein